MASNFITQEFGTIAVDSGTILLLDPCNIDIVNQETLKQNREDVLQLMMPGQVSPVIGVVVSTGIGDGLFRVTGTFEQSEYGKTGYVLRSITIHIIDEEEETRDAANDDEGEGHAS